MPSTKEPEKAKPPGRANSKGQRRVHSEMAVGTTLSGPSHQTESLTELADHAAEQQILAESVPFNSAEILPSTAHRPSRHRLKDRISRCPHRQPARGP